MDIDKYQHYAPLIVRWAIALVFVWFGLNQLFIPEDFLGYLPDSLLSLSYASTLVMINGVFELIAGGLLLWGVLIRPVSLLLFLHLISIIVTLGYNDLAIRDAGLALVTLALFIGGNNVWKPKQ